VGIAGMVLVAIVREAPLRTVCVHPDGSSSYGGAEVANIKSKSEQRDITPAEERQMLEEARPITDMLAPKAVEDSILIALAGAIAEGLCWYVSPADFPEAFARAYDRLGDLPETSPLALLVDEDDPALRRIQELVIDLLTSRDDDLYEDLVKALKERHVLTPADIQTLIEAQERGDEGSGAEN
jgi:hypothetical protein